MSTDGEVTVGSGAGAPGVLQRQSIHFTSFAVKPLF